MAFQKKREQKELNLPSLIDVVFLLLIFSLVTIPVEKADNVNPQTQRSTSSSELPLPFVASPKVVDIDPVLRSLLIQVENRSAGDPASGRVVYVLRPSERDTTIGQTRQTAIRDSLFAAFPDSFLRLSNSEFARSRACRLIHDQIGAYLDRRNRPAGIAPKVEIRAVRNTEFRIVNYIMRECSAHGDTLPSISVRTFSHPM
jgi:hypothetical protein